MSRRAKQKDKPKLSPLRLGIDRFFVSSGRRALLQPAKVSFLRSLVDRWFHESRGKNGARRVTAAGIAVPREPNDFELRVPGRTGHAIRRRVAFSARWRISLETRAVIYEIHGCIPELLAEYTGKQK